MEPQAQPSATSASLTQPLPDWRSLWDVVPEVDLEVTQIRGRIPRELYGLEILRNGPGKRDLAQTFFDGDGMLRSLRIDHRGQVRLKTRYVRTPKYLAEKHATTSVVRSAGTPRPGGILANALRLPAAEANTSLMPYGDGLLALHEGSHPFLVDAHSLMTLKQTSLGGVIPKRSGFSAHPHGDPKTGEIFNFGLDYGRKPLVHTFRQRPNGDIERLCTSEAPYPTFLHDFAVSQSKIAFLFAPQIIDLWRFMLGLELNFFEAIKFQPERGSELLILSRDGKDELRVPMEARCFMHVAACFDRGDELWVYAVRDPDWHALCRDTSDFRNTPFDSMGLGTLWLLRIDLKSKRAHAEEVSPLPMEFPQIDPRCASLPARFVYCAATAGPGKGGLYRQIARIDLEDGSHEAYDFGAGHVAQEPLFIPRGPGESAGFLLAYVHNDARRATDVVILDAEHVGDGPICVMELSVNLGLTFHGIVRSLPGPSRQGLQPG